MKLNLRQVTVLLFFVLNCALLVLGSYSSDVLELIESDLI